MSLRTRRRCAVATTSWLAISAAISGAALAQTAPNPGAPADETAVTELVVVGARASQQSAIQRKKRARTATDSIVADDVGSFPDRNLNEAISRIAGVAVDRNEYGEGQSVSIRGNGPDFTRVELDGIGVQSTGGGMAIAGGALSDVGRGADMRELPADLIKSVDVVKGSTADMTEGSLGGGIRITTRSGLDFKKPYFSVRLGAQQNELGERITPDFNLVASRKFMDDRLGIIASYTQSNIQLNQHQSQVVTSGNSGYARAADFDNSPEKTFEFNLDALQGVSRNDPFTSGTGVVISSETPISLVTKSISAKTKAECLVLFPNLNDPAAAIEFQNQRFNEQQTCLNQWNDYTPSLNRLYINWQDERRVSADVRLDYRVNDNLTVYGKYAIANRNHQQENSSLNPGSISVNGALAGTFNDNPALATGINGGFLTAGAGAPGTFNTRTELGTPDQLYYVINPLFPSGVATRDINPNPGAGTANITNRFFPNYGTLVNVVPGSVKVDDNHHVTEYVLTNGVYSIGQNSHFIEVESSYMQFGGEYNDGPLRVEFVANRSESFYSRDQFDTSRVSQLGRTKFVLNSSGIFEADVPDNFDDFDGSNFVQPLTTATGQPGAQTAAAATFDAPARVAYTAAQRAQYYSSISVSQNPGIEEGEESAAKIDVTYDLRDRSPLFTRFKSGYSYRNGVKQAWGRGGRTVRPRSGTFGQPDYDPGIYVPSNQHRGSVRACAPTADSVLPGGEPCPYGFVANTDPLTKFWGVETFKPDELIALVEQYTIPVGSTFFDGYPGSTNSFTYSILDTHGLFQNFEQYKTMNFDCIKVCTANDGKVYAQPFQLADETFHAFYAMIDFGHDLPFGMEFDGNIGIRVIGTERNGSGVATFNSIRKTPLFNSANPNASNGITTSSLTTETSLASSRTDALPSFNFNLWVIPDKVVGRFYTAKTVTQPNISRLIPNGTCSIDQRTDDLDAIDPDDLDQACTTMGNPALKPYEAQDMNLALEWYPNRDTSLSVAWHRLDVKTGGPIQVRVENQKLFAGTDLVDSVTGRPLANEEFAFNTFVNAAGYERTGFEIQAKTAFTFLPWILRHTGADYNYSELSSSTSAGGYRDPLTNEGQVPQGEATYFQNLSVWYDDGRFQARVSYQARGETFVGITGTSGNNVNNPPIGNPLELVRLPYNPGEPFYRTESKFIDAKLTYKITPSVEVFVEGRNLKQEANATVGSDAAGRGFADGTPTVYQLGYGGRRFMFGLTYRFGN